MQNQTAIVDLMLEQEALPLDASQSHEDKAFNMNKRTGKTEWYLLPYENAGVIAAFLKPDAPRIEAYDQVWVGLEP